MAKEARKSPVLVSSAAGLLGAFGIGIVGSGEAGPPIPLSKNAEYYSHQAKAATLRPFIDQANNGLILDQTIWNYHFEMDDLDELHLSGRACLDRLAKRQMIQSDGVLHLYVQTAHDIPFKGGDPRKFQAEREERNRKRLEAVSGYMAAMYPEVPFTIAFHDPHPVGMIGREASRAAQQMLNGATGIIPTEIQGGLSITPQKLGGGSPPALSGTPPPSSEPPPPAALGSQSMDSGGGAK